MAPMDEINQAHDAFFKEMISRLEPTRDFLANYLPPDITGLLDMDTLEICKDSFVDAALEAHLIRSPLLCCRME